MIFQDDGGKNMAGGFFDFNDGDYCLSLSDNMGIDSEGHTLLKMSDNMAIDVDTGDMHLISGWSSDDED